MYDLNTPYSTRNVFINSIDANKISNVDKENGLHEQFFEFYLESPISAPPHTRMVVSLSDFQIPNILPNIVININNKISFLGSVNGYITLTFPMRFYNIITFMEEFHRLVALTPMNDLRASFNYNTLLLTFTSFTENIQIVNETITSIIEDTQIVTEYPTTCVNIGVTRNINNDFIYPILGVDGDNSCSITMPSVINFTSPNVIFLKCNNILVNNLTGDGRSDQTLARIDVNCPFGYVIYHRPTEITKFLIRERLIEKLRFSLETIDGIPVNIEGLSFQATLTFDFIYPPSLQFNNEDFLGHTLETERRRQQKMLEEEKTEQS